MGGTPQHPEPIFERLPHGPSGLAREEVARNQRIRMYGAMIESVHQRGYRSTTVAHVIALAGVSRRAFYEQFSNKEDCFLATHDIVVARARKQMVDAWEARSGFNNRVRGACAALLENIARFPKGPRLVLVDSLGIGPRGRDRMLQSGMGFELIVGQVLERAPDGAPLQPLLLRGLVGGIRHVAFLHMLEGRESELASLGDQLVELLGALRSPLTAGLGWVAVGEPGPAPASRAAFLQGSDARKRSLAAIATLTLRHGYAGLTDAQIASVAGMSTEAFHRQFAGREQCFLALVDELIAEAVRTSAAASERCPDWSAGVRAGMAAFVGHLVANQALSRLAFVELFEVGPAAVGHVGAMAQALTSLLCRGAPPPRHGPKLARQAIAGGLSAILCTHIADRRMLRLPGLVDQLSFLVLAPHLGAGGAVEAIGAARAHRSAA
jgi:AcrR family transcriptional regulator